ncbi:MAG: 2-C-methyl-D-erythritol 4-phosphate cytidylyltransferase [Nocardioides sp.]
MTELDEAVGVVPTDGRGSLPFALLHNEALVAVASWALGEAGVELLDFTAPWSEVVERGLPLVVHDPLCPGTSVDFLRAAVAESATSGAVVAGVRPVTDTVKHLDGDVVGATVDRTSLVAVASPVVLPAAVVAGLDGWPDLDDVPAFVDRLRGEYPVTFLEAPPEARRVADESDVRLLEAASAAG